MRVTQDQFQENRRRILAAAARLFRARGFDGVSVAEVMKAAGLTHGGFYGHFPSKDDLAAAAYGHAMEEVLGSMAAKDLGALAEAYLSPQHRDDPGGGCVLAAVGAEAVRQQAPVRRAVSDGLRGMIDRFTELAPGRTRERRRERAVAATCTLVGALMLSRIADDEALSDEILRIGAAVAGRGCRDQGAK